LNLVELWRYRELVYFLTWRDIKVRYKQTSLGIAWALLQPLLTMLLLTVVFGRFLHPPSDGIPYSLFTLAALVPWMLISRALTESGASLMGNSNLITKVYFPRLALPLAGVLGGTLDFAISLSLMFVLLPVYGRVPPASIFMLPAFMLLAVATALGISLWLSALTIEYRDLRYAMPFAAQILMLASPVAYSASVIPASWRPLYALNPVAGVVEGFRWSVFHQMPLDWAVLAPSTLVIVATLISGAMYFRRMERTFADHI
jgi:lipopolysaccharide transport system permease protein